MDGFLAPTSRPASAMSQSSYEEDMPLPGTPSTSRPLPTILVNTPGDEENVTSITKPTPYVYEYIKDFWGPSKNERSFKCRMKFCNKDIKYAITSFSNLKTHYEKMHPAEYPNFVAALSAGYNYKKRGRHLSGAR
jgi:hypothetical protein